MESLMLGGVSFPNWKLALSRGELIVQVLVKKPGDFAWMMGLWLRGITLGEFVPKKRVTFGFMFFSICTE